jgi:hypothetical protein
MRRHKSAAISFAKAAIFACTIARGLAAAQIATAGTALSACDVLSKAEVELALGRSVSDGRALVRKEDVGVCSFATPGGSRMLVLLRRRAGRDWTASQVLRMKNAGSFRPVASLGDQAFLLNTGQRTTALCVFYRDFYLEISISRVREGAHSYELLDGLCRRVVRRLEATPAVNQISSERCRR